MVDPTPPRPPASVPSTSASSGTGSPEPHSADHANSAQSAAAWAEEHKTARRLALIGLIASAITVLIVLILVPIGVASVWRDLPADRMVDVYNLWTGQPVDPELVADGSGDTSYLDLAVSEIHEAGLTAELVISGHRICTDPCPPFSLIFYAIPERGSGTGGLPPSFQVDLPTVPGPFTFALEMPVTGRPQTYPWDTYSIQLGISVVGAPNTGEMKTMQDVEEIAGRVPLVTLQSWMSEFEMSDFRQVDRSVIEEERYPHPLLWVHRLSFTRPAYLQIVTGLLLGLIAVSSLFVLFLRSTRDTMIGIGGLVLGLWSIRSVIVKGDMPDVTVVDLVIGMVMVLFLTLTWARVTWHFWRRTKYGPAVKL